MVEKDSILVVDDDEMILESLVSILDSEGYKVRNNGKRRLTKSSSTSS